MLIVESSSEKAFTQSSAKHTSYLTQSSQPVLIEFSRRLPTDVGR